MEAILLNQVVVRKSDHWGNYQHIETLETFFKNHHKDRESVDQELLCILRLVELFS